MRLLAPKPTRAAELLYATACSEAAQLSFAVGVEHLVLACAVHGALDVEPEEIRDRIRDDERRALASLGISLDLVRAELGESLDRGCLPVSPEAKRLLALATRRRRHVSAPDLLAVLLRESGTARGLLARLDEPL